MIHLCNVPSACGCARLDVACYQAAHVQGVQQVMLDIEGPTWNFTQSENRDYIIALRSAVERGGLNVTIYCTNWPETFGPDFTAFKDVPLIYAVRAVPVLSLIPLRRCRPTEKSRHLWSPNPLPNSTTISKPIATPSTNTMYARPDQ